MEELKKLIRDVPNFPKPGILFRDITPLLQNPVAFKRLIHVFRERFLDDPLDKIIGIESRGFIFGAALSIEMEIGFIPVRKGGKLPWTKISEEYVLEYGSDRLEMHADALTPGERVLIVDDLLATGGTVNAVCRLVEQQRAIVGSLAFVVELDFLNGREKLKNRDVFSVVHY